MPKKMLFFVGLLLLAACQPTDTPQSKYPRWVGDISADPELDDADFTACNEKLAAQYFHLGQQLPYKGEKYAIEQAFAKQFVPNPAINQSGLIRIRFMVNCEGRAGRFRMIAMDTNYQEQQFDPYITDQLMEITKSLDGWEVGMRKDESVDYYQYLIFKIEDGQLKEIMP